jgi:hypothetical protein
MWQHQSSSLEEAEPEAMEHVVALELTSARSDITSEIPCLIPVGVNFWVCIKKSSISYQNRSKITLIPYRSSFWNRIYLSVYEGKCSHMYEYVYTVFLKKIPA